MTINREDRENQQHPEQHTSSIIKDLDQLRTLSMEEMSAISGGQTEQNFSRRGWSNFAGSFWGGSFLIRPG